MIPYRTLWTAILCAGLSQAALAADPDASGQANNPLANSTALNLQDQIFGDLNRLDDNANTVFLRFAKPLSFGETKWITRTTVPIQTSPLPGGGTETGLGDADFFAAYLIDTGNPAVSFGIGPEIVLPTATDDAVGSGKLQLGVANVLFNASSKKFQWGYLLTWRASVTGENNREDVSLGAFQPFGYYQLGEGWYLRSSAISTYNFENDAWQVPVGLGGGKVFTRDGVVWNIFAEPLVTVARDGVFLHKGT